MSYVATRPVELSGLNSSGLTLLGLFFGGLIIYQVLHELEIKKKDRRSDERWGEKVERARDEEKRTRFARMDAQERRIAQKRADVLEARTERKRQKALGR